MVTSDWSSDVCSSDLNMIFVDDKQQKHDRSTKNHATKIRITSTTRHQKHFSTSNTKVKARTTLRSGQHDAYLDETLELGVAVRRELLFAKRDDVLSFTNIIGYTFIIRRLEKQSKLNLKIHGPHGPKTRIGADLQAFLNFYFKPNSLTAH